VTDGVEVFVGIVLVGVFLFCVVHFAYVAGRDAERRASCEARGGALFENKCIRRASIQPVTQP
jgi:hypothetical protein